MRKILIAIVILIIIGIIGFQLYIPKSNFNLKVVNLNNTQLTKLPTQIGNFPIIEELNISNNQLTGALPSEIGKLTNLKRLDASNNQMTGIPAEIGKLQKLEYLNFSNNQITGIPNELGELKSLKNLDLSGNTVSKEDIAKLQNLLPNTDIKY